MKKSLILTAALAATLLGSGTAGAASNAMNVSVDGKAVVFNTAPIMRDNTTLVQIAPIFRSMGIAFTWDAKTKQITATKYGHEIIMTVGSKNVFVDGKKIVIAQPPQSVNGNIFVPLRFISEATGANVTVKGSKIEVTSAKLVDDSAKIAAYLTQQYPTLQSGENVYPVSYSVLLNQEDGVYIVDVAPASFKDMMQLLNERTATNTVVGSLTRAASDDLHKQFGLNQIFFSVGYEQTSKELPDMDDLEVSPNFVGKFTIGQFENGDYFVQTPAYNALYDYKAGVQVFMLFTNDNDNIMMKLEESKM